MIILAGIPSETPLQMVGDELKSLNSEFIYLNQREFEDISLDFCIENKEINGTLQIRSNRYELNELSGIYIRFMDENFLPEIENEPLGSERRTKCRSLHESIFLFCEIAPCRVVNRMSSMGSNSSKPYQAQIIRSHGFNIPETLISNEPKSVLEFKSRFEKIVYKSISSVRSIVQVLGQEDLERLKFISWCPVQFQEYIEGLNVRVHVIGDKVFATSIESDFTDYRYAAKFGADTKLKPYDLDHEVSEKCISLSKDLELDFTGIDLKIKPNKEIFCFEVNPSPAYNFYESNAHQPIARCLAEYLTNRNHS